MSDAANPDTLDYDFATPHTNGTSISGEPMNEVRRTTARRVSFGEIAAEYLKSLSPHDTHDTLTSLLLTRPPPNLVDPKLMQILLTPMSLMT